MKPVTGAQTGWDAWSSAQAEASLERYELRKERLIREETDNQARLAKKVQAKLKELSVAQEDPIAKAEAERKRAIIAAAIARAQAQLKKDPPQQS
jgi:electron transport complex protein RnfB